MMRMSISCDYYIDVRHDTNTNTVGTCRLSVVSDCNKDYKLLGYILKERVKGIINC